MTDLTDKIAALPKWASEESCDNKIAVGYCQDCDEQDMDALRARLALAREWIAARRHAEWCETFSWSPEKPCTCGRDALLAALEEPK